MTETKSREEEIVDAERERCQLANERDWEALDSMLADEMTFVHSIGVIEDKAHWLANLTEVPRRSFRDSLNVRVLGDVAVTTGGMFHVFLDESGGPIRVLPVVVLQVWVNSDDGWKLLEQQHTRTPAAR